MPDGQNYTQDQDFLSAPPEQQHAYLSSVDSDYAAAPPEKQKAYIASLGGTMTEKQNAARPPTAPNLPIKPVKNLIGGTRDEIPAFANEKPLGAPILPSGAGLLSVPRMAGSVAGSMAGGEAGNYLADKLGVPEKYARFLSDALGVAGGSLGAGGSGGVEDFLKKFSIKSPQEISLPGGFKASYKGQLPAEGTGAPLPSSAEYYEQKAADLMRRGREQGALDRAAARNAPKPPPETDPTALAVRARIANWLPTKLTPPEPPPETGITIPGANSTAGEPRFTGSEGRPATWTNERVLELASKGNRDAISQATRRGLKLPPNARYVMGDQDMPRSVYNPREVTRFGPDNEPIRNKANPPKQLGQAAIDYLKNR